MPITLTEESEPLNILYYGDGGSGKTTDLMTWASLGKIWVANAESGVKARALKRAAAEMGIEIPTGNIELFPGPDEELSYDGLEAEWKRIREELHKDPQAYVATNWDSVTEIQQAMKDNEVARSLAKANRMGQARDPFVVDQDNWRTVNEQCRSLIRKFRDLPCHFGASALQRREQDSNSRVAYMPGVTPGLQNDLIGWVDVLCHTEEIYVANQLFYMGGFTNEGMFRGKDRFHALPRKLVNPTATRVHAYIEGDLTVESDDEMQALKAAVEAANDDTKQPVAA